MQGAALWVLALYHPFRHLNGDVVGATNLNFHSKSSGLCATDCHILFVRLRLYPVLPKRMGNNGRKKF